MPHNKNTAGYAPDILPVPPRVRLPMGMSGGAPAKPAAGAGGRVKVGQLVGEAGGGVSSPIHASVSGVIKSIDETDPVTGEKAVSVVIESDGAQSVYEGLAPPRVTSTAEFLQAVRDSGVVGLGGAGYPTWHKLTLKETQKLDYILINGMECESYITPDTRTMTDDAAYVLEGARLLQEYLKPKNIIVCIEDNKPGPIGKMTELFSKEPGMEVRVLPALYPQGERKTLVYNVAGRTVPEGARLPDVGCVVINCSTVAVMAKYIKTGMPMVSRCVTVDGPAVKNPKNVIAPIGAPARALFEFCGGFKEDAIKIVFGGAMTGMAKPGLDMPIVKTTSAVLAFGAKDAEPPKETACIKCGRCVHKCPMRLMPSFIEEAYELKKPEALRELKVGLCAECGCCAYVCPAKRPLLQVMLLSKQMLWEAEI